MKTSEQISGKDTGNPDAPEKAPASVPSSEPPLTLKKELKNYFILTAGVLFVAAGVYFFKFPNNYSIGGVTGAAILLSRIFEGTVSSSSIVFVINLFLLIIGYLVLGKGFGLKTAYGSFLLSGALSVMEWLCPMDKPLTTEPMVDLFFAVTLPAVGSAILFNYGGSTGGTDIVAMILKKYTHANIGQALFCTDVLLTLATFPLFGATTGFLSLTGLILKSVVVDNMIESMNLCKYFTVICENPDPICSYILNTLNRSATICDAQGAFSHDQKKMVLTVMTRTQAIQLLRYIKRIEPNAFIMITNTSEIIGRGFRA